MNRSEWEASVEWVGIVAGCLVKKDDKFLLVQEKQPKVYGLWNLPAGFVDKNESIEDAAKREVKEESGYEVELLKEIGIHHESTKTPVKHIFRARVIGGKLTVQENEILDVKWLSYDEIETLHKNKKLRAPWLWEIIKNERN